MTYDMDPDKLVDSAMNGLGAAILITALALLAVVIAYYTGLLPEWL